MSGPIARWRARQQEHDAWLAAILAGDYEIAALEQARRTAREPKR